MPKNIRLFYLFSPLPEVLYHAFYAIQDFWDKIATRSNSSRDRLNKQWLCSGEIPLISILCPTFERTNILIDRTIPSILAQTFTDFELVLVSDGPEPEKRKLIQAINDPRIVFASTKRRAWYPKSTLERWMIAGYRARNLAIRMARGKFFYWISDDDVLLPNCLDEFAKAISQLENPACISMSLLKETRSGIRRIGIQEGGFLAQGIPWSGIPAFIYPSDLRIKWRRFTYVKSVDRPGDYDLVRRIHKLGVNFEFHDSVVAFVPFSNPEKMTHGSWSQGPNHGTDLTVLLSTDFRPGVMNFFRIYRAVRSINRYLLTREPVKIIISVDGLHDKYRTKYLAPYRRFLMRLRSMENDVIRVITNQNWGHLSGAITNSIEKIDTGYVLVCQVDLLFIRSIDAEEIIKLCPEVGTLRLNKRINAKSGWDVELEEQQIGNAKVVKTNAWTDCTHISRTSYYRDFVVPAIKGVQDFPENIFRSGRFANRGETLILGGMGEPPYVRHIGLYTRISDRVLSHTDSLIFTSLVSPFIYMILRLWPYARSKFMGGSGLELF